MLLFFKGLDSTGKLKVQAEALQENTNISILNLWSEVLLTSIVSPSPSKIIQDDTSGNTPGDDR